jgi:hypothetical protein
MRQILHKIKPARGFSHILHILFNIFLPVLAYILVRIDFVSLAILLVLLSKWRMFAVRPRYWMANLIANGVDIMTGVSFVMFMANTSEKWWQIFWVVLYALWLTRLKPRSDVLSVSVQAMIGQLLGLSVLFLKFGDAPLVTLVAATWVITYVAARHFLTSFEEPHSALLAHIWAYFSASLTFVLGHWLLFYGVVAQIIIFLTVIGYSMAAFYYLDAIDRLTPALKKQLLGMMILIILIVILQSDWHGSTI